MGVGFGDNEAKDLDLILGDSCTGFKPLPFLLA